VHDHGVDVLLVDAALALAAIGLVSLLWPLRFLRVRTRSHAASALLAGLSLLTVGLLLPVSPVVLPGPAMAMDGLLPSYPFGEHHEIDVAAPRERVYAAVRAVTAREIRLFLWLTWLRSPRLSGPGVESILNPAADRPILDVALDTTFVVLHEEPGRELVVGTIVCCGPRRPVRTREEFWAARGSVARALMNFHLEERGSSVRLVTQTRIHASDRAAERRFAAYWRLIYPGSALIRRMWLRAIRDRAEKGAG
jgi:hypothetical protein